MKKMRINTLVCIMLALALVLSNLAGLDLGMVEAHAGITTGEDGVYEIYDYAGLKEFAAIVNAGDISACAKLMNNITCTDKLWTPIGNDNKKYIGHFDGQKHKIIGLSNADIPNIDENSTENDYQGLFGYLGEYLTNTGIVENVSLEDSDIHGRVFVGGVAGNNLGSITNSYNMGTVTGQGSHVGGVAGNNLGSITNS